MVVDVLGLTVMYPLLPFYAEHFGATATEVGLLVSAYAACQLVSGPLLGRASDHMGRRLLLLLSQAGTLLGFLILANARALWMVFLSRVIDGATAGNLSLAQAYISDVTRPEERARSFGIIGIAFGIGFLIGPALSGYLAQFGIRYPIYAAAALSATSIACTYFLLPRGAPPRSDAAVSRRLSILAWGTYARYFRMPVLSSLLRQFFAYMLSFSLFMSGFALFAERRFQYGPKQVGYVYAYVGFLGIILQGGLLGRLVKRFGEHTLVRAGFLFASAGFAALAFTYNLPALLIVSAISSLGSGALRPALTSLITQAAGPGEQGSVLGLTQSLMSVAQICAPFAAGLLIDHSYLAGWALLAAAFTALGLFL